MKAYHFTSDKLRDGMTIPKTGQWLVHEGELVPCKSGLHASKHPFDALTYAPGNLLHFVEIKDYVNHGSPVDKVCGRRRKILATIDATDLLRDFARWCALQVVHLWDAPEIVIDYLNTGDESKREAARAAAWAAARDAARAAARDAGRAAAWAAAEATAWAAARAAAEATARAAARAAARDAAGAAARAAAWAAAWAAATEKQRKKFAEMCKSAFAEVRQ